MRAATLVERLTSQIDWEIEDILANESDFDEDEIADAIKAIHRFVDGYITQVVNQKISEQQDRATDDAIAERKGLG